MYNEKLKKSIFISTFILFLLAVLFHFAYELLNSNFIIGLITPVNESIFEHLKLSLFPIFLWWLVFYIIKKEKYFLDKNNWFLGCLVSMITSILIILGIHYFVNSGIGKEIVLIDIISLYIAVLFSQFLGLHFYKYSKKANYIISLILIFVLITSFMILTVYPFKIPLFEDKQTKTYGINKNK